MAIHNVVFLTKKIKDLSAINAYQKRQQEIPYSYIANGNVLTTEDKQHQIKKDHIADKFVFSGVIMQAFGRAPPKCSICSSTKHNFKVCLTRTV